jgi:hypothetical protein
MHAMARQNESSNLEEANRLTKKRLTLSRESVRQMHVRTAVRAGGSVVTCQMSDGTCGPSMQK